MFTPLSVAASAATCCLCKPFCCTAIDYVSFFFSLRPFPPCPSFVENTIFHPFFSPFVRELHQRMLRIEEEIFVGFFTQTFFIFALTFFESCVSFFVFFPWSIKALYIVSLRL